MRIIGGKYRGKKLLSPLDIMTRPTSDRARQAIFNILEHRYYINYTTTHVLDLFAGTGALGCEALSRGAVSCIFIENHFSALKILQENTKIFKDQSTIISKDIHQWDKKFSTKFSLIFMDPPYGQNLIPSALGHIQTTGCLDPNALFILEIEQTEEISSQVNLNILSTHLYGRNKIIFANLNK